MLGASPPLRRTMIRPAAPTAELIATMVSSAYTVAGSAKSNAKDADSLAHERNKADSLRAFFSGIPLKYKT
jgi:hypothetical protein